MAQRIEVPGMGVVEFPDGMSDDEIADAIKANMPGGEAQAPETTWQQRLMQNVAAGLVRGAGSIGATLATPVDALLGNTKSIGNPERRQAMDDALASLGADTGSFGYGLGKLGGEVAGTAGAGPLLAGAGRAIPAVASRAGPVLDAVGSAGFTAGGLKGAAGLGARTVGGGVTGAAAAGMVNPDDATTGGVIGAALPGVLKAAGAAGATVSRPFRGQRQKSAEALVQALGDDPSMVAARLKAAREFVPGSKPTVSQVLRTPEAGTLERIVSETPGGSLLKRVYDSQNAARIGALDRVAPVDPRGFRSAQDDLGEAALEAIRGGDKAARAKTSALYQSVPQDEAALYLPDLAASRDKYFPRGSFGNRAAADQAAKVAELIGNVDVPAVVAAKAGGKTQTLAQAVRQAGGISIENNSGLRGEVAGLRGDLKNLVRRNGGKSPAEMAELMQQRGFLQTDSTDELFEALRNDAFGGYTGSMYDDIGRSGAAARDAAMGAPPAAERVPQKVTLREFDALRKSIGNAQRAAKLDPDRATEALALSDMKAALDDKLNEVVAGDGLIDEAMPVEWADALDAARKSKLEQVQKYRTGPQALAFRTGSDGMPLMQGGEFAAQIWGNRPGIADAIKQVRKVIDDHPKVLGQFKSMITTEGAGTSTNAGNLTGKFVRWVDNALPGLKASFSPSEVKALERIAADIKRAESAVAVGMARGSPTFQNASNALSLGLLDSPLLGVAANRIPIVNQVSGPILNWMRDAGRSSKAKSLAELLADPVAASEAINGLLMPAVPRLHGLQRGLLTSAPILGTD